MVLVFGTIFLLDRHKIGNFGKAVNGEEARDQNVSLWQVELFMSHTGSFQWRDTEEAAFADIKESAKDTGRVEAG